MKNSKIYGLIRLCEVAIDQLYFRPSQAGVGLAQKQFCIDAQKLLVIAEQNSNGHGVRHHQAFSSRILVAVGGIGHMTYGKSKT